MLVAVGPAWGFSEAGVDCAALAAILFEALFEVLDGFGVGDHTADAQAEEAAKLHLQRQIGREA